MFYRIPFKSVAFIDKLNDSFSNSSSISQAQRKLSTFSSPEEDPFEGSKSRRNTESTFQRIERRFSDGLSDLTYCQFGSSSSSKRGSKQSNGSFNSLKRSKGKYNLADLFSTPSSLLSLRTSGASKSVYEKQGSIKNHHRFTSKRDKAFASVIKNGVTNINQASRRPNKRLGSTPSFSRAKNTPTLTNSNGLTKKQDRFGSSDAFGVENSLRLMREKLGKFIRRLQ